MELPFLKSKNKQGGGGPLPVVHADRTQDMDDDKDLLSQVADEFIQAIEKKDHGMMIDALKALIMHIQQEDQEPDSGDAA